MSNSIRRAFSPLHYFAFLKGDPQKCIRVVDNILLRYLAVSSSLVVSSSLSGVPLTGFSYRLVDSSFSEDYISLETLISYKHMSIGNPS